MEERQQNPSGAGFSLKIVRREAQFFLLIATPGLPSESYGPFATLADAEEGRRRYLDGLDLKPFR